MGEVIAEVNRGIDREIDADTRTTAGTHGQSTSTAGTGTGTGTDTRTNAGTGTSAGTETEKDGISGLALLTDDERKAYESADEAERKRLLKNAKRRYDYAEKKKSLGQSVAPRKVNKQSKQKQNNALDTTQLNVIIATISGVIASRPNMEHWLLSEQEINSITTPLSKMLAESEAFANMGQYSNQIALVMACVTVFTPRIIVSVQKGREGKKIERTGQSTDTIPKETGKAIKVIKSNDGKPSSPHSDNGSDVSIYGSALY